MGQEPRLGQEAGMRRGPCPRAPGDLPWAPPLKGPTPHPLVEVQGLTWESWEDTARSTGQGRTGLDVATCALPATETALLSLQPGSALRVLSLCKEQTLPFLK